MEYFSLYSFSYNLAIVVFAVSLVIIIASIFLAIIRSAKRRKQFARSRYARETESNYSTIMSDDGAWGEYRLGLELERFAPDGLLLFNVYVPRPDGSTSEVDALCIDESGIYVFENKNYSGWVFGRARDRTWTQTFPNGEKFQFSNPVRQNEGHVKALQEYLSLDRNAFFSIVVFSDRCELKKVDGGKVPVIQTSAVLQTLSDVRAMRIPMFSPDQAAELYSKLKPCANATSQAKEEHIVRINASHDESIGARD